MIVNIKLTLDQQLRNECNILTHLIMTQIRAENQLPHHLQPDPSASI